MKPLSWDKQPGLASPRESAASQSDQTNYPSKNEVRRGGAGCKLPRPHLSEGRGESFFFDILFKSALSFAMLPETCDSTCTVITELMVPVASNTFLIAPRSYFAVEC